MNADRTTPGQHLELHEELTVKTSALERLREEIDVALVTSERQRRELADLRTRADRLLHDIQRLHDRMAKS